jgi:hypothetical protein
MNKRTWTILGGILVVVIAAVLWQLQRSTPEPEQQQQTTPQEQTTTGEVIKTDPIPGPIIIVSPTPDPNGVSWTIDGAPALRHYETNHYNNRSMVGPFYAMTAYVLKPGDTSPTGYPITSFKADFGAHHLEVKKNGDGLDWYLDNSATPVSPAAYETDRHIRHELWDSPATNLNIVSPGAPAGSLVRIELQILK